MKKKNPPMTLPFLAIKKVTQNPSCESQRSRLQVRNQTSSSLDIQRLSFPVNI
jgi:hypothetical protein